MHQTGSQRARAEGSKRQPPAERANLYDEVTGRIVSELEAGRFPWVQPWGRPNGQGFSAAPGLPRLFENRSHPLRRLEVRNEWRVLLRLPGHWIIY